MSYQARIVHRVSAIFAKTVFDRIFLARTVLCAGVTGNHSTDRKSHVDGGARTCLIALLYSSMLLCQLAVPLYAAVVSDPEPPASVPDSGHSAPLVAAAYSADGAVLYTVDSIGELRGRATDTGASLLRTDVGVGVTKLRVLGDGSLLLGRASGAIVLFDKPGVGKRLVERRTFNVVKQGEQLAGTTPADAPTDAPPTVIPPTDADNTTPRGRVPRGSRPSVPVFELGELAPSPDASLLAVTVQETPAAARVARPVAFGPLVGAPRPNGQMTHLAVWDLRRGERLYQWESIPTTGDGPRLAWDALGKTLLVALPEVGVQRFEPRTGALQGEWKPPAEAATTPDPAALEEEAQRRMKALPEHLRERVERAEERRREQNAANPAAAATPDFGTLRAISPDGSRLLAATRRGWQLWELGTNSNRLLDGSQRLSAGSQVQFSPDGKLIAAYSGGTFWLWSTEGSQIGFGSGNFAKYTDVDFTPDGRRLALADDTAVARQWATTAPLSKTAQVVFPGYFQGWRHLSALPNGVLAATANGVAVIDTAGKPKWMSNPPIEAPELPEGAPRTPTRPQLTELVAAPDGQTWVETLTYETYTSTMMNAGIPKAEVRGRDMANGDVLWRLADHGSYTAVADSQILRDGTLLTGRRGWSVSAGPMDTSLLGLQARDSRTGETKDFGIEWGKERGYRDPGSVAMLEASRDGKYLLVSSGSGGNGLQIIDLQAKKVANFFGSNVQIDKGEWDMSWDGEWLARTGATSLELWDLQQKKPDSSSVPTVRVALTSAAHVVRFGRDRSLAVGLADGRILFWASPPANDTPPAWETAPGRTIHTLEFSTDGKTLWSGDERGDLVARDAQTGQWQSTLQLSTPKDGDGVPTWVHWTRDGKVEAPA